ncbi:MAG: GNAT family N-acetyltransferase [Pseudomonadota bacterium]
MTWVMYSYQRHRDLWPLLGQWHHSAWGAPGQALSDAQAKFKRRVETPGSFPLGFIAMDDSNHHNPVPLGTIELKLFEMPQRPDHRFWVGEVFVTPTARGQNVAGFMVQHAILTARQLNLKTLTLQTDRMDGGLYAREGFKPIGPQWVEARQRHVLVMTYDL